MTLSNGYISDLQIGDEVGSRLESPGRNRPARKGESRVSTRLRGS